MRVLHGCACWMLSWAHSSAEKVGARLLPCVISRKMEELVCPLVRRVEGRGLGFLAAIDDKMHAIRTCFEESLLSTSAKLKMVPSTLHRRGLIGTTSDLWVMYETGIKEDLHKAVYFANKVPLVNLVIPALFAVSMPAARHISDWLVKHSESGCKGTQSSLYEGGMGAQAELACDVIEKEDKHYASGSKDVRITIEQRDEVDNGPVTTSHKEKDKHRADEGIDVPVEVELWGAEKVDSGPMTTIAQEEKDYLPNVLELIDSSWSLGSSASPSRALQPSQHSSLRKMLFGGD